MRNSNIGYLNTGNSKECFGCEACVQECPKAALVMKEDEEGFRYPLLDEETCVHCGLCHTVCPYENPPQRAIGEPVAFGGYHRDVKIRGESTSGGAFSALVDGWWDSNTVLFGAVADGLRVFHTYGTDKGELSKFRKSKYSQSVIGASFQQAKECLEKGKKVLFSGTPCQIAGLKSFLQNTEQENLLTVEVVCEGVPSPLFVRRYDQWMQKKYRSAIAALDYRDTDMRSQKSPGFGKWDFQVMRTSLQNGRELKRDRWRNPFWSIWLNHLMSRPSCYQCPFASTKRNADLSLGDLWGVHLYCPELYGHNAGASLIVCNTQKGRDAFEKAKSQLFAHELDFSTALNYQGPMRKPIAENPNRALFMKDLLTMDYRALCRKWAKPPTFKLLWQKYVWGNRQKVWLWNLRNSKGKDR